MDRKHSPKYPEREYFAHSGGKNDNMPARNPKGDVRAKERLAANPSAQRTPEAQTLKGRPPTRVEPNCDALDKLSGPLAQRSTIQAES